MNNSALEVEVVDVCSCDLTLFPEEAINWADACVVVYDVTLKETFKAAVELLGRVKELRTQIPIVLLGNKCDLEHLREVRSTKMAFLWLLKHREGDHDNWGG